MEKGSIKIGKSEFTYTIERFAGPQHYGILGGRIKRLTLFRDGFIEADYHMGWEHTPKDADTRKAVARLVEAFDD